MKMICNDCERIFDEAEICWQKEYIGDYGSAPAYQDIACCPYCSSDEIDEKKEEE